MGRKERDSGTRPDATDAKPIHGLPYTDHELLVLQNLSLPGWLALALLPKNAWARGFAVLMALLASAVYAALMGSAIYEGKLDSFGLETFQSLDGLVQMFSRTDVMLVGWMHYVAFDLMVGVWICQDAFERGYPHLLLLPVLVFTALAGPGGLLLYALTRLPFGKRSAKP